MQETSQTRRGAVNLQGLWSRTRRGRPDGRLRRVKIHGEHVAELKAEFRAKHGREPSFSENALINQVADRLMRQAERRAEEAFGSVYDHQVAGADDSAISRDLMKLGLVQRVNDAVREAAGLRDLVSSGS
jgi:hypothetical protein